ELFQKKQTSSASAPATTSTPASEKVVAPTVEAATPVLASPSAVSSVEKLLDFHSENLSFQISSKGMGLKNLKLKRFTNRKGETVDFPSSFETTFLGTQEPIDFDVQAISDRVWVGHAKQGGVEITKTMNLDPEKYSFDMKVAVQGQDSKFIGLMTTLTD